MVIEKIKDLVQILVLILTAAKLVQELIQGTKSTKKGEKIISPLCKYYTTITKKYET